MYMWDWTFLRKFIIDRNFKECRYVVRTYY